MATFTVKGYDETVENVEILGEIKQVGNVVELDEETAAPLVAEGKLVPLGDTPASNDSSNDASAGDQTAPNDAVAPDAGEARTEGAPSDNAAA